MAAKQQRAANPIAIATNAHNIGWYRTLGILLVATACGILGLTGVYGVVAYLLGHFVIQVALLVPLQGKPSAFTGVEGGVLSWLAEGLGDNVLPYLVVWSFAYAVVHIF